MTRYNENHIPGDDGRNKLARMMNKVIDFVDRWGAPSERFEVAKLMVYLAEKHDICEAEETPTVCRNPDHQDVI